MSGPLTGITIIEFSGIGPGPFCGMVLADMGAEVIRIDRLSNFGQGNKLDFQSRSKLSLSADLKDPKTIEEIKKFYSSGSMTALQKNAESTQKWPLLNLVRQILKTNNYLMHPVRKSNGYTKDGKKKYLRFFTIKKIKSVKEHEQTT